MPDFIECTSLNVSYDITGIATVSYTVMSTSSGFKAFNNLTIGGLAFKGIITNAAVSIVPQSDATHGGWYRTQVTLLAIAG